MDLIGKLYIKSIKQPILTYYVTITHLAGGQVAHSGRLKLTILSRFSSLICGIGASALGIFWEFSRSQFWSDRAQ